MDPKVKDSEGVCRKRIMDELSEEEKYLQSSNGEVNEV